MEPFYTKTEERDDYDLSSQSINLGKQDPSTAMTTQLHRTRNEGVVPDFIQKLFNMLESTDETSCYHWGQHGRTFVIDDTNEFAKTVLPSRFKHGNFSSFVRQLNKYDFHKIRFTDNKSLSPTNQQVWEFQHPLFRRDRKEQLGQIHRKVNNNRGNQRQSSVTKSTCSPKSTHGDEDSISDKDQSAANMNRLQGQINKLTSTQQSMELTMQRLLATDNLLLEEIHGLKRKLDEKDSLISALLEQPKHHRSVYSAQQQHPLSSPMLSPQSPSLKLYPWLQPPTSSSITPPQVTSAPQIMHAPMDSSIPLPRLKNELDGSSSNCYPAPAIPTSMPLITLPAINTLPPSTTPPTATPTDEEKQQHTTCHDWSHRPKVLVVEDNVMYRRISMRCLQRLGCDLDLACDGLEAVACMKTSKYDLILMDISIPKLDGMAATRNLRQYDQHTPVVSMTANYSDHDIENYVGSGMSDLLPKPFDQYKLYDILKQHCAHLI
ncbi:hypothetical protein BC941DRAFT_411426 [Chlamydoabsidia padenii]|nr:hypothetical protein BC941DRAFT_411426 [Chlamydoabsidia padenii]